jgi:hypothetical protein
MKWFTVSSRAFLNDCNSQQMYVPFYAYIGYGVIITSSFPLPGHLYLTRRVSGILRRFLKVLKWLKRVISKNLEIKKNGLTSEREYYTIR